MADNFSKIESKLISINKLNIYDSASPNQLKIYEIYFHINVNVI